MFHGLEHLQIIERKWSSVCKLKLKHNRITQQEDDPMHKIKSTSERLKKSQLKCWSGLVKILTWIQPSSRVLKWQFMLKNPPVWLK